MNFERMDSTGNLELDLNGNSMTNMVPTGYDEDDGRNNGNWVSNSQQDLMDTTENAVLLELFFLCERASGEDMESWDDVRQWLRDHTTAEAREAAIMTGDDNATPLFLACSKCAPVDIIEVLVGVAPQTAQTANNLGWLPMHIACHFHASLEVLRILVDAYPASMKSMDKRGRTPLHFALANVDRPVTPAAVLLLLSGETGRCPDMGGLLVSNLLMSCHVIQFSTLTNTLVFMLTLEFSAVSILLLDSIVSVTAVALRMCLWCIRSCVKCVVGGKLRNYNRTR